MKRFVFAFVLLLAAANSAAGDDGFRSLFNGKDLGGWDGDPELWSVVDGCITGRTTGPEQLTYNQFLVWRGGVVHDFELRAQMKLAGGNSGIQYRGRLLPDVGKWSIGGYQCDVHPAAANNSMVFGEKHGGILARNGQNVVIDPMGKRWLVAQREPVVVDVAEWHEYSIVAQGNHLVHKIDGRVTAELRDFDKKTQTLEGLLAFQLHRGPAMKVQIKDVMLKVLPPQKAATFDKATLPASAAAIDNAKPEKRGKAKAADRPKTPAAPPAKTMPPSQPEPAANRSAPPPAAGAWKWIWNDAPTPGDGARLKKEFELAAGEVQQATLRATCDNGAKLFLNGELVLVNRDWPSPTQADVKAKLRAGRNELLVEAANKGGAAAFVGSLAVRMADGAERTVVTDASWLGAGPGGSDWRPVKVVADYGARPWGDVFHRTRGPKPTSKPTSNDRTTSAEVLQPADVRTLPGFQAELIHTVPKDEQGSWVGLTVDDRGRLLAADQYGGLYRLAPPPVGSRAKANVEKLDAEIAGAHGLLYAFDSLYVLVNEKPACRGIAPRGSISSSAAATTGSANRRASCRNTVPTSCRRWRTSGPARRPASSRARAPPFRPPTSTPSSPAIGPTERCTPCISSPMGPAI